MRASQRNSFGAAFNNAGGGVYASESLVALLSTNQSLSAEQCNGMKQVYQFSFSRVGLSPRTLTPAHPSPQPGVIPWHGGRRHPAIPSSSSPITRPSLIQLYGMQLSWHFLLSNWSDTCLNSGDWANGAWSSAGIPGQEESCAQRTGFSTCEAFVRSTGSAFNQACACQVMHATFIC